LTIRVPAVVPAGRPLYIERVEAITHLGNWGVVLTTLLIIGLAIGLHYEALRACIQYLPAVTHPRRRRVIVLIFVILVTHAIEIWLFALGYFFLLKFELFGTIEGETQVVSVLDHVYYSAMVYTTVGFGDIIPYGPIRFMTGMEAVTGLVMITWSASFTFLEMQRDWPVRSG
jgi:hypothetical protein